MGVAGGAVVISVSSRATADIELVLGFGTRHIGTGFGTVAGISAAAGARVGWGRVVSGRSSGIDFGCGLGCGRFIGWSETSRP